MLEVDVLLLVAFNPDTGEALRDTPSSCRPGSLGVPATNIRRNTPSQTLRQSLLGSGRPRLLQLFLAEATQADLQLCACADADPAEAVAAVELQQPAAARQGRKARRRG